MPFWLFIVVIAVVVGILVFGVIFKIVSDRGRARFFADREREKKARDDAFFKASFPELQPYLHPFNVLQFVDAWRKRPLAPEGFDWEKPAGLDVARARLAAPGPKGIPVELLDASGEVVSRFLLQDHPEGGAIRVDPGKLTVNVANSAVRYWHPAREFKWSLLKGWRVLTAVSNRPIETSEPGMSFSSDTGYSSSDRAAVAGAAAAGSTIAAAGGSFDGGGSSESWDGAPESRTSY